MPKIRNRRLKRKGRKLEVKGIKIAKKGKHLQVKAYRISRRRKAKAHRRIARKRL